MDHMKLVGWLGLIRGRSYRADVSRMLDSSVVRWKAHPRRREPIHNDSKDFGGFQLLSRLTVAETQRKGSRHEDERLLVLLRMVSSKHELLMCRTNQRKFDRFVLYMK